VKIALISDIHGNLQALEAVLENIEREQVEQIVCLGDVAFKGPQPHEVVNLLKQQNCLFVLGNTDAVLFNPPTEQEIAALSGEARTVAECFRWTADNLTADDWAFLRRFADTQDLAVGDGQRLLCFHGSPTSAEARIHPDTDDKRLAALLADTDANFYAGGHVHVQFLRPLGSAVFINPGSVGFSRSGNDRRLAEYAVLDFFDQGYYVKFKQLAFDWAKTVQIAKSVNPPHLDWLLTS